MTSPLITIKNLCTEFDGKNVLKNLSFEIREGEIVGIIGRSGAGKSVLMHLLRGVEQPPSAGSIVYHVALCDTCDYTDVQSKAGGKCPQCEGRLVGKDVDLWKEKSDLLRSRVMHRTAIMFQRTFALYGNDRVIENVLHALDDVGYPPENAINRAADLLEQVRLGHRMMHIARDLSGGEKQRVVLARQLAKNPVILFADEPTGTLDPRTARLVHEMLVEASQKNRMGMVITSHFSGVIKDVAHRALLLDNGEISREGPPQEVISSFLAQLQDGETIDRCALGERILSARDVTKKYITVDRGVVKAVNGVSFEVAEHEIFGIIGTSGSGKTTLSRMIAGIVEPTTGELNMRVGEDWVDMTTPGINARGRAKGYIGLLHQEYDLFPHRTVLDNLTDAIGLEFPKELAMHKAKISLRMAGFPDLFLDGILQRFPSELSEGERHRVALAQVLIREPRLVILDEPTGTMDPITKVDVKQSILHARYEMEETFIVVSHDIDFVRDICDRVALMRGGKIIQIGPTMDVLDILTREDRKLMAERTASVTET